MNADRAKASIFVPGTLDAGRRRRPLVAPHGQEAPAGAGAADVDHDERQDHDEDQAQHAEPHVRRDVVRRLDAEQP